MKRILLVGGGSGGHVYPLIAVANALKEKARQTGADLDMRLWGDGEFINQATKEADLKSTTIISGKLRRYFSLLNFLDFFKIILGFLQSLWLMYWYMPDIVFIKGGSSSVMPAIAAKLYLIPLIIHESDSVPGLANKLISKIADKIQLSFESSQKYFKSSKVAVVGNPVRRDLAAGDKNEAVSFFKLDSNKKTILILGGSQGAKRINDLILESLVQLVKDYQIIHQAGDIQYSGVKAEADKYIVEGQGSYGPQIGVNYRLYPFFNNQELKLAYAAADVIVCRGGAGLIFETALVGKPTIIIPLSTASANHQFENGREFSQFGASMLEEDNLTSHILISQINSFLKPENYQVVSEKIKSFAKPEAAATIAELLLRS